MVQDKSIADFFAGKTILLSGATGFLARALTEKLLRSTPDVERIYLLIRNGRQTDDDSANADFRLKNEIIGSSVFDGLRQIHGAEFDEFIQSKLAAVAGDLTLDNLGIEPSVYEQLAQSVDIVINSAASVVFTERVDFALELNTLGPSRMLEFAKHCGNAAFIQVSTAYVNGRRSGLIPEEPFTPNTTIAQITNEAPEQHFELDEEIRWLKQLTSEVTEASQNPDLTCRFDRLLDRQNREKRVTQPHRAQQLDAMRSHWVEKTLVDTGIQRARELGWYDNYTYTKALAEQLIVRDHGDIPVLIVRPSIIESSLREPDPGWLDGLKVADPLFAHYGKGRLPDFPIDPEVVLDIIPVDMVVNAIIGLCPTCTPGSDLRVYHVSTSSVNPVKLGRLFELTREHFTQNPMRERDGKPISVSKWKFPSMEAYRRSIQLKYKWPLSILTWAMDNLRFLPWSPKLRRRVSARQVMIERILSLVDIYGPYTHLTCEFSTKATEGIYAKMSESDRTVFPFDVSEIDWREYIQDIHLPGLKRHVLKIPDSRVDLAPDDGEGINLRHEDSATQ
jgi:nucleoside-diphosphate-sugar epimerase